MTLWLVRHARPLVEEGICYGASNLAADPQATQRAARALAQVLPKGLPMGEHQGLRLISSPLQRCEQLAQCLRGLRPDLMHNTGTGTDISPDSRLAEMNFGRWEGQRWDALPRHELDGWAAAFSTWRCGGAECVQDVMARVAAAWDEARAHHAAGGSATVWITHAGVIRAANLIAQGVRQVQRADQWPLQAPAFGAWQVLDRGA